MRGACALVFAMGLVTGTATCGPGDSAVAPALDCAWVTGDNCWKATLAAASACLPSPGAIGAMSADRGTCSYSTGQRVTFSAPLSTLSRDNPLQTFNFTVATNGVPCLTVSQPRYDELSVTTSAGTVRLLPSGGAGMAVVCPNGVRYTAAESAALLACPRYPGGNGVTDTGCLRNSGTSCGAVSFYAQYRLVGTAGSGVTEVFGCEI